MVVIRLSRTGGKKKPFYHVVATDKRNPRDGKYIERLGYYNPGAKENEIQIHLDMERVDYWLKVGAQPSPRFSHVLKTYRQAAGKTA